MTSARTLVPLVWDRVGPKDRGAVGSHLVVSTKLSGGIASPPAVSLSHAVHADFTDRLIPLIGCFLIKTTRATDTT